MRQSFRCLWCDELVVPGDLVHSILRGYHYACALRSMLGSIGHVQGKCSCYVANSAAEHDPPELTKRQAAGLVADYVRHQQTSQPGRN